MLDAALEAKVKSTKVDAALACEGCEEVTFDVEDFDSSLDEEQGVMRLVIEFMSFLGVKDAPFYSKSYNFSD